MSTKKTPDTVGRSEAKSSGDVGYGKPPVETRFKPGVSGNPSGRSKTSSGPSAHVQTKKLLEIIRDEFSRTVSVTEGGKQRRMMRGEALVRQILNEAAKNPRFFSEIARLLNKADDELPPPGPIIDLGQLTEKEIETFRYLHRRATKYLDT